MKKNQNIVQIFYTFKFSKCSFHLQHINSAKFCLPFPKNSDVYWESVPPKKKIPHCAIKFGAGEENGIIYESLYWILPGTCRRWISCKCRLAIVAPHRCHRFRNYATLFFQRTARAWVTRSAAISPSQSTTRTRWTLTSTRRTSVKPHVSSTTAASQCSEHLGRKNYTLILANLQIKIRRMLIYWNIEIETLKFEILTFWHLTLCTGRIQFVVLTTLPILPSWIKKVSRTTIENLRWQLSGEIIRVTFGKSSTSSVQKLKKKLEQTEW